MRHLSILVVILLLSFVCSGQQQDGSLLERRVSLNMQKQPVSSILNQLSWLAGVYFSYNSEIIDSEKKKSIEASEKSLFSVLNELFNSKEYVFYEIDNQIIITKKETFSATTEEKKDTIPVKYFFLKGKIVDSKKEDPVTYATISFLNKPFGTISNNDGDFLLKVHPENIYDTLFISCMGFSPVSIPAFKLLDEDIISLIPKSIRLKEIKVTAISPQNLLQKIRENRNVNYSSDYKLMSGFYRETVQQDEAYISVSEAVVEILKAPYDKHDEDEVRLIKGRRSPDVKPFVWLNFKLQGGPFTITRIDIVKTIEGFIDPQEEHMYKYSINRSVLYNEIPVYVLSFEPLFETEFTSFRGELFVDRETFAIVHANFGLDNNGLKNATRIMIKKKPANVSAKPTFVNYEVNYRKYQGKYHFLNAKASIIFKVKSRKNHINSEFFSTTDVLVTDIKPTNLTRFPRESIFKSNDVFVEMIKDYDDKFWENYNIIRPDEELENAFKSRNEVK